MFKRAAAALLLAFSLFLSGCGAGTAEDQKQYAPDESRRLVIYTSHKEEVYQPIIKEFEERTGIWVNVVPGGTNELLEQIELESDAPVADVMFGGGVENLASFRDCFAPYVCAEADAIDAQFCDPDALWTPFSALPVVLVYNTKLVSAERLTGWSDLLSDETLRGRVAFTDPAISGSCFTALVTMLSASQLSQTESMQRFAAALDGRELDSSGAVLTAVADGSAWVGVTLEETALKRIAAGDNIALVYPADGTSCVPDGSALIRGAPHEENAKLFLDFTVSRDVQELLAESFYRRPIRSDVEAAAELAAMDSIPMADYDIAWACENREVLLRSWEACLRREAAE